MEKFSRSLELMKASWQVLKADKEILVFPVISGIALLIVMASFIVPMALFGGPGAIRKLDAREMEAANLAVLFLFYFVTYFVMIFFNAAIVACATIRMNGGDPTVADGINAAADRIVPIAGWALVSATVGMILRMIAERSRMLGRIVAGMLGMAWSVTSFLVIPILVNEGLGPVEAFGESVSLLKKTWGEEVIGNFSFGLVFFVLSLPAFALIAAGMFSGKGLLALGALVAAGLYWVGLMVVQSALQGIFQAALYQYAKHDKAPEGFQKDLLRGAIHPRF